MEAEKICKELANVFSNEKYQENDPAKTIVGELERVRKSGKKIVVMGVGREGLMMRALCMRLFHLGLNASCVGDMNCPPISHGDLLMASAGPGAFATVDAVVKKAKSDGARVLVVTAQPSGPSASLADVVAVVPATTMADDVSPSPPLLPMGSLYEGALFVLFEIVVLRLMPRLGETMDSLRARHTNLE